MSEDIDGQNQAQPKPWRWLLAGLILTVVGCVAGYFFLLNYLNQPPPEVSENIEPTIIVLTAPPSPTIAPTSENQIPTPVPTFTPIPTPDTAVAPPEITAGFFVVVANTDGLGVTIRGGPSISNESLQIAQEGSFFMVLDGPAEADGFNWWQLQLEDGSSGWAAANFLDPSAAP